MQRTWRYEIDEDFIQLKHGFLNRHHTIVPMSRVEYVNTEQGPLLRRFELSVLTIGTLASTHEIPALTLTEATIVRNKIARLAQIDSNHPNEMNEQAQTPDMRLNENDMNNDTYEDEYKDE